MKTIIILISIVLLIGCMPNDSKTNKFHKGDIVYILPDSTIGAIYCKSISESNVYYVRYKAFDGYKSIDVEESLLIKKE